MNVVQVTFSLDEKFYLIRISIVLDNNLSFSYQAYMKKAIFLFIYFLFLVRKSHIYKVKRYNILISPYMCKLFVFKVD